METNKLHELIDKIIGRDGPLRVPTYWMNKLFKEVVGSIENVIDKVKNLSTKTNELNKKIETTNENVSELSEAFNEHISSKTYPVAKVIATWSANHYTGCITISHFTAHISNLSELFPNGEMTTQAYVDVYIKISDTVSYLLLEDRTLRTIHNATGNPSLPSMYNSAYISKKNVLSSEDEWYINGVHSQNNLPIKWRYGRWTFCVNPYPTSMDFDFEYITTDAYITNQESLRNKIEVSRWDPTTYGAWKNVNYCNCIYDDGTSRYNGILNTRTWVLSILKDGAVYTATYDNGSGSVGTFTKVEPEDLIEAIDIEEE